jgi:hypothetical protein
VQKYTYKLNYQNINRKKLRTTAVTVAQPPFFKNKIVNYKKTTSFKAI